jgi:hypothetical protein
MRQKESSGDFAGVGVSGIVVLAVFFHTSCLLPHKLSSSTHFSISILSRPAEYRLLVSVLPDRYLEDGHNCCTGPVYHQGARRGETDNSLPILTTETQSTTATSRILWDCEP